MNWRRLMVCTGDGKWGTGPRVKCASSENFVSPPSRLQIFFFAARAVVYVFSYCFLGSYRVYFSVNVFFHVSFIFSLDHTERVYCT